MLSRTDSTSELGGEADMETLYDTLPPVPEGKQLSQLRLGLLMYRDMKYNLNLTGISHDKTMDRKCVCKLDISLL